MPDYIRVPKKCVNVIDVKYILMGKEILIQLKHPHIQLPARTSPLLFMTEATSMCLRGIPSMIKNGGSAFFNNLLEAPEAKTFAKK